ncbi:3-deoxy-8-phosphooctulonate synthase [Halochromatium roseum]|uniref:3-deoxy-8-phosphooctulonate synthase n=1 Tax=Halochromatium roseum TaxID=391920 RepID=UPI001912BF78|nr:3-deoxy-8-phosphooctulonate synthase [Halochromatium roseum]MBK5940361.1 3-deoxy-8-phosphooctulonate synthase [Halochromatium roseum]
MTIRLGNFQIGNTQPLTIIGGLNVLESQDLALEVAQVFVDTCSRLGLPYVFKGSFDKANRSSIRSYRGSGLEAGLEILAAVKQQFGVPVITDVHEPFQAAPVAEVVDILQLPAFLSRQTDLVTALAATGRPINVKKAQFLAPAEMAHIAQKCREAGNDQVMICERGTQFGYNNLVVDMLGFPIIKQMGLPLIFDVTHALQLPGGRPDSAGGRRQSALALAKSGVAQGIAGLFLETHPDPEQAKCDGPSALPLRMLDAFLGQLAELDRLVKQQPELAIL